MKALIHNRDGLGDRLKTLASAYRLTDDVASTCNTFNVVLESQMPVLPRSTAGYELFTDWRCTVKDTDGIGENFSTVYMQCCPAEEQRSRTIDFEFFRIPEHLRSEVAGIYSRLKPCIAVRAAVDLFTAGWGDQVIAVHVRSWTDSPERRKHLFDLDAFFREIDRRHSYLRIYVAADDPAVVDAFISRYGSRVVAHPLGRSMDDSHICISPAEQTLLRAFTEMLCLSRGVVLVGTYLSSFTECAWWFGGARQHVVIV